VPFHRCETLQVHAAVHPFCVTLIATCSFRSFDRPLHLMRRYFPLLNVFSTRRDVLSSNETLLLLFQRHRVQP
jgi:hypothetical protein